MKNIEMKDGKGTDEKGSVFLSAWKEILQRLSHSANSTSCTINSFNCCSSSTGRSGSSGARSTSSSSWLIGAKREARANTVYGADLKSRCIKRIRNIRDQPIIQTEKKICRKKKSKKYFNLEYMPSKQGFPIFPDFIWIRIRNLSWSCQKSYSEILNNEYIGRIYQMSSWQFFIEFYTILRKFQYLRK